ncbi:ATP-binding protein [Azospira restricta]|uniref:histidine kinase n=1 Tax=Azospira restricta TaxID=404405 RepID=A0A974SNH4_9RHOO|nr:ATP-binding protein [Azospira restricta]QRJ62888.1 HAMP domain-containing protein [Azospira restricta]
MPALPARLLPDSLAMRIFLVLLLGILVAAALTFGLAQQDRREVIAHFHARENAQRIADLLRMLATLPPAQRRKALDELNPAEWRALPLADCAGRPAPVLAQGLEERLAGRVGIDAAVRLPPPADASPQHPPPRPPAVAVRGRFADGETFCIVHQGQRRPPPQIEQWRFPLNLALFVALIALVCWLAVRLALRPLQRMAAAAEAFGRDLRHPPLATAGPAEVRQAAQAFNVMQEQVREVMAERTQILAAVTHDLKTPLTRLRLRLESCTDPVLREKLGSDLDAMQRLVDEGLELARSMEANEAAARVDLGALLASIADDAADAGQPVRYEGATGVLADCRPNGLRRAIENLVGNALKYGGEAEIRLEATPAALAVRVLDRGPGIPEDNLGEVLRPFVRLEASRSRESGGTGLGLAIASNLIAAQGGTLTLANRPQGGLEARITLPRPAP